jgi:hypothetical protein
MVQLPLALQERRLSVRRRVHIVALLHCHRLCRSVVIADCSRDGLLLESTCAVAIGERATVALLSGHRLPVQVMWVAGIHIGVRFFGIQAGHPGMLALWEAAEKYGGEKVSPASHPHTLRLRNHSAAMTFQARRSKPLTDLHSHTSAYTGDAPEALLHDCPCDVRAVTTHDDAVMDWQRDDAIACQPK